MMKLRLLSLFMTFALAACAPPKKPAAPLDLSGDWQFAVKAGNAVDVRKGDLKLQWTGSTVTGSGEFPGVQAAIDVAAKELADKPASKTPADKDVGPQTPVPDAKKDTSRAETGAKDDGTCKVAGELSDGVVLLQIQWLNAGQPAGKPILFKGKIDYTTENLDAAAPDTPLAHISGVWTTTRRMSKGFTVEKPITVDGIWEALLKPSSKPANNKIDH